MSNQKGNGIEAIKRNLLELGVKYQKSMDRERIDGLKISDLLDQNDLQSIEIRRLTKLTSNYGTVCKDCCTATDNQLKLTKANRRLKTLNNWACIALSVAAVTITLLLRGK